MTGAVPRTRPADNVAGLTTPDGWYIESLLKPAPGATGGRFSSTYTAVKGGHRAFLKALDYVGALRAHDPARALQDLTTAYNFERNLVRKCEERGMRNVVRVLADGHLDPSGDPLERVSYLVFELAEGDIRRYRALAGQIEVAWALRTMHHAALGLHQLHLAGIAHQDLKPSNLLLFDDGQTGKLGDLGRACVQSGDGPYDHLAVAGDRNYAPPEGVYGLRLLEWGAHRKAHDLFHLGSLLLFQFTGVTAQAAIFTELDSRYWPGRLGGGWRGSFDDVITPLRDALGRVSTHFPRLGDASLEEGIRARFLELCHPDPRQRGHPKDHARRHGDPYSVERYVSNFNAMAARAERRLPKVDTA